MVAVMAAETKAPFSSLRTEGMRSEYAPSEPLNTEGPAEAPRHEPMEAIVLPLGSST